MTGWLTIFGLAGLTIIATQSRITAGYRSMAGRVSPTLGYLSKCPMCSGFWIGLLWALSHKGGYDSLLIGGCVSLMSFLIAEGVALLTSLVEAATLSALNKGDQDEQR